MIASGDETVFDWSYGHREFLDVLPSYMPAYRRGPYEFQPRMGSQTWHIDVRIDGEPEPVGFATMRIEEPPRRNPPAANEAYEKTDVLARYRNCLLYTSPSPRDS